MVIRSPLTFFCIQFKRSFLPVNPASSALPTSWFWSPPMVQFASTSSSQFPANYLHWIYLPLQLPACSPPYFSSFSSPQSVPPPRIPPSLNQWLNFQFGFLVYIHQWKNKLLYTFTLAEDISPQKKGIAESERKWVHLLWNKRPLHRLLFRFGKKEKAVQKVNV